MFRPTGSATMQAPEDPIVRTQAPVAPAKRPTACGWCDSTHIADVTCTCKEPCAQGWCPAAVDAVPVAAWVTV